MPIISVTRFKPRSLLQLPSFAFHASRAIDQIRRAEGWIDGAVKRDADHAFWTMTVWKDEESMLAYVSGGAHGAAMPRLADMAVEASVVRWSTDSPVLPAWSEAVKRMRTAGRPSRLRRPGPDHVALAYPNASEVFGMRL
ncbi:DUF3291 domain-containing protein [Brevundimonas sp.]|uniref:DUF3291 domain-containing protein n=1 Tax=Brevundimonas sp. TaxID=1871086 RepID=UPI003565B3DB